MSKSSQLDAHKLAPGSPLVDPCLALLELWPYAPLRAHAAWPSGSLANLTRSRMASLLTSDQSLVFTVTESGTPTSFAILRDLPWDTSLLALKCARIEALIATGTYEEQLARKSQLVRAAIDRARSSSIEHISARVDAADLSSLHALEAAGFVTIDGILTFALDLDTFAIPAPPTDFRIALATHDDAADVYDLGRVAYIYDRFHADSAIARDRADAINGEWARNSVLGTAADATVIARDDAGLLGFVTCKLQHDTARHLGALVGTIVLVATAPRARGRGVARSMTFAALHWFKNAGCKFVDVGTQIANIPASRLYESAGFKLVGSSVSLRWIP